ncbi:MAG: hypothetical protein LQ346_006522 [Caloplaca aetnensis]|nr:MAG: hypothetical protein LQ346_006522 [Caloplaca aetnensis]
MRSLKRVGATVKGLTHTLHLPPAQADIYDGPHPEWLRDVLVRLPNFQSLVVSRLPFFDHACLLSLLSDRNDASVAENARSSFNLRLLIANQCANTTPRSLADGLIAFPHLVFLDLSRTLGARDAGVLSKLRHMDSLQILKLCGIQLRDDDIEILADAIGIRVRSLDICSNSLTDHSLRTLLHSCVRLPVDASPAHGTGPRSLSGAADDDWPSDILKPDPAVLDEFRDESFDERYLRRLTNGLVNRLPSEDQSYSGITHLYIADNRLTVEGVASLIKSTRLHVLDAGTVDSARHVHRSSPAFPSSTLDHKGHQLGLPGAETLPPILAKYAHKNLTSLRIDHSVVTQCTFSREDEKETSIRELDTGTHRELDIAPPVYELPDYPGERLELPGDSSYFIATPDVRITPEDTEPLPPQQVRRNGIDALEVTFQDHKEAVEDVPVTTATGMEPVAQSSKTLPSLEREHPTSGSNYVRTTSPASPHLTYSKPTKQSGDVRFSQKVGPHGLLPSMLPNLRSLTLTDVPCYDHSGEVVNALIQFIRQCASEFGLAKLQIDTHSNDLNPGRSSYKGRKPVRPATDDIFALRKITLEMSPPNAPIRPHPGSRRTAPTSTTRTKSSTEDPDSEAFWLAQEGDFSFFDDDEECGLPSVGPDSRLAMSTLAQENTLPPECGSSSTLPTSQPPIKVEARQDVVQQLAKFREDRKAAYEIARNQGQETVEGYWPGEVKIVRAARRQDGH